VRVAFVDPEAFTDASLYAGQPVQRDSPVLADLRRILERLGRRLPGDRVLEIEVLDVDLAGYFEPWRIRAPNARVLTPATSPRIRLRFALLHDGHVVASGEDTVTDASYLLRPSAVRSLDLLRYEEPMLRDWFDGRIRATAR
jgi:hypothetical protein